MARQIGFGGLQSQQRSYNFGGATPNNGAALLLPRHPARSYVRIQNTHASVVVRVGIGPATAVPTTTNGAIASVAVVNGGFGYTHPPIVEVVGGGIWRANAPADALHAGLGGEATDDPAQLLATLSGGAVNAVNVSHGGSGYRAAPEAPYIRLENDARDPFGCFLPSATAGFLLGVTTDAERTLILEGPWVATEAIGIFSAAAGTIECMVGYD